MRKPKKSNKEGEYGIQHRNPERFTDAPDVGLL